MQSPLALSLSFLTVLCLVALPTLILPHTIFSIVLPPPSSAAAPKNSIVNNNDNLGNAAQVDLLLKRIAKKLATAAPLNDATASGSSNNNNKNTDADEDDDGNGAENAPKSVQEELNVTTLEGDIDVEGSLPSRYLIDASELTLAAVYNDVIADRKLTWPNARVPYAIDSGFGPDQHKLIELAMRELERGTCVKFVPKTSADMYGLYIRPVTDGCFTFVGFLNKDKQFVNYGPNCFKAYGTIIHELMHALGFFHTQSRTDRDKFVSVHWDKLRKQYFGNFEKYTSEKIDDQGQPYDYGSLMHYPPSGFGLHRGDVTLSPVQQLPPGVVMGQRNAPSKLDKIKINLLYKCPQQNIVKCAQGEVLCGTAPRCAKTCDGIAQCSDGSDERNCSPAAATKHQCSNVNYWQCPSSAKCINKSWICDGINDCPNGEDESQKNCATKKCTENEISCSGTHKKCVPAYRACDGRRDCPNGEDESASLCGSGQNNFDYRRRPVSAAPSSSVGGGGGGFWLPSTYNKNSRSGGGGGSVYGGSQPSSWLSLFFPQHNSQQPHKNYGSSSIFSLFSDDPYSLSDQTSQSLQRFCFFDMKSFHDRPENRLSYEQHFQQIIENGEDLPFCTVAALGYANIDPSTLQLTLDSNFTLQQKILSTVESAKTGGILLGTMIVIGSDAADADVPALQTLLRIGNDVTLAKKFAESTVRTLRAWNASGLTLQWLKPQLEHASALTTLIKALSEAVQYDTALLTATKTPKKTRLIFSMNVVPKRQPGQDLNFIWQNVDFVTILPDLDESQREQKLSLTNPLLSSLAAGNASAFSWLENTNFHNKTNIGVHFNALTYTLPARAHSTVPGAPAARLGAPGPLSATSGTLTAAEVCMLAQQQPLSQWQTATDYSGSSQHMSKSRQWIAYEAPNTLRKKLANAKLKRFNGVYVMDVQDDDINGVCGSGATKNSNKKFELLRVVSNVDNL